VISAERRLARRKRVRRSFAAQATVRTRRERKAGLPCRRSGRSTGRRCGDTRVWRVRGLSRSLVPSPAFASARVSEGRVVGGERQSSTAGALCSLPFHCGSVVHDHSGVRNVGARAAVWRRWRCDGWLPR
jgi:hypothetical protein